MNTVQPIRDKKTVEDIAAYLRQENERDYVMFMLGIYSGLRISDILKLRVRDVREKESIYIREKKTGKEKRFVINPKLRKVLKEYTAGMDDFSYIFRSQKGKNRPISRTQAYRILSEAGEKFGLESIGTHTLRKTFGYHLYQQTHDLELIRDILNHSNETITRRYIGITQEAKDDAMNRLSIF